MKNWKSFGCGQEHKAIYKGTCETCGSRVYSESCVTNACDARGCYASDPRGHFGERHTWAPIYSREQGYAGRDINLCAACANDGEKYRAVTDAMRKNGEWSKRERGHYHVAARKWFDRVNGNTYHSVSVTFPDGTVQVAPYTYGYGNHYQETAGEIIAGKPLRDERDRPIPAWRWYEANGITVNYDVVDVQRKKDLHAA